MKLPRCQYRSKSKMQRPMKCWLENPMNKRPLIPSSTCRLGRLGLRTYLGQPHRKVILRRHSISLFHQVSGGTKNKKPQEQPSSSLGCGRGSPCPVMAPGSLTTDSYDLLTTQLLVFWGNRLWSWGYGICEGTSQLWDLFIQGHWTSYIQILFSEQPVFIHLVRHSHCDLEN